MNNNREKFSSRLGFILISAGCAIGLGNVWRFPYITGVYGGAIFVAIYLFFLVALGLPVMTMEFAVGRASQKSVAQSFHVLQSPGAKWHLFSYFGMLGNYLLMMFYTTISGWMFAYLYFMLRGDFVGLNPEQVEGVFGSLVGSPQQTIMWLAFTVALGFFICSLGLNKGVERVTKVMMSCLFVIMVILVVRSVTLPGAAAGLAFYLKPNLNNMLEAGVGAAVFAAMGQAFFTLSIGMGSMAIFGSYIKRERRLLGEAVNITILDTCAAFMAGLIIFPACSAFGIAPDSGPNLVFITLPNIFNEMAGGRFWGSLFFLFMCFAALSTVIAVFENILSFAMDLWGWTRKKASYINMLVVFVASLPCALGFNLWSGFEPLGKGTGVLDLEDFIVSNNVLPIGALVYLLFCVTRYGWGWKNFLSEANEGAGLKFPAAMRIYCQIILPAIILAVLILGYVNFFK